MEEIWKDIIGYEGLYKVSNLGRIKSLERKVWNRFQYVIKKERILEPRYGSKGYVSYALFKNGERKDFKGHWLVLSNFVENIENKPQINHINGKKDDNRVSNLEWCTNGENQKHAIANGLRILKYGKDNPCSIKVLQYDLQGNFIKEWSSISEAHKTLKAYHITDCCKGKRKHSKGYVWRYKEGGK